MIVVSADSDPGVVRNSLHAGAVSFVLTWADAVDSGTGVFLRNRFAKLFPLNAATLAVAALVPVAVPAALNPLSGQMPNFIFAGVVAGGIVLVLTWVAMPVLVKVARGWLQPKSQPTKKKL